MKHAEKIELVMVDDSEMIRGRLIAGLTLLEGIATIRQAGTVEAARELLKNHQPDIILLDVDLGGKNGMDLLAEVNRQGKQPLVIMLSNYDHPRLRARCLELGATHYCHKTADFEKLIHLIEGFIQQRELPSDLEQPSNSDLLKAARLFRDREERYRALFDRSMDGIFVLDLNGKLLDANDGALTLCGNTPEDLPHLTLQTLLDPDQYARAQAAIMEIIDTGALRDAREFTLRRKDGGTVDVEVKASLIVRDGKPYGIHGIARDITARKQAEAEIRRLNRLYSVLSQVNQTLIRATTKEELFQQVCEIAVERGGFRAVVLGWLDADSKAVVPAAHAGTTLDILGNVRIFADDRPEGQGPTGTAVREGRNCVMNNLLTDPRVAMWHEIAQKAGVHSVGSFPIRAGGQVCGALSTYSNEINGFGEEEINLLSTVADNISSGLDRLEQVARQQQAEESLKASEESYRVILRETGQIVFDYNLAAGAIAWSGAVDEVLGYEPGEIQRMTPGAWHECIHPEDRERAILIKAKAIRLRARYQLEYRLQRKDGTYVFVEERGSFFAASDGQARRMLGTITNITERKSTEEHLREQARLLDLAHDAILVLDLDDTIQYWNSSAERLYGWTAEQALGRKAAELLRQDATVTDDVRKAVMNKEDWAGELTHLTREGQSVLVEARLTLVRDRQGSPKSILSINTDITERKKMETQFLRAQRMESIGVLASGIAHDLNNVFAPILMAGELLDADGPGTDRKQLHALIQNSAQRGADLVRQICAFCRGVEGRRTKVHIGTVISELESILVETFPKSIEIRVVLPKILWAVVADPTQLYQVLLNLCVNARDAMPNGGVLTLSAENATLLNPDEAGNPQARPTAYLRLIVSDTGTGIPDEIRERIFDPFFTTKELGKGTGLGLSTTLGIVKGHDGFINLYSETGKGTAFNIYLPALGISKTGPRKAVDLDLPRGNGDLVMVVDDEASIRAIATQTLQSFGYKVIAAQNGAEALDLYGRNAGQIAAVIVDVMMPVMDGLTAIHAMRRMNPALKVIAASGLSPEAHGIQASNEAIKSFLLKPYSSQTLLNTLDEVIHNKKGNAA